MLNQDALKMIGGSYEEAGQNTNGTVTPDSAGAAVLITAYTVIPVLTIASYTAKR